MVVCHTIYIWSPQVSALQQEACKSSTVGVIYHLQLDQHVNHVTVHRAPWHMAYWIVQKTYFVYRSP